MTNNIQIPFGALGVAAIYKNQVVEEYRSNPYIEALPNILTKEEIIDSLTSYPHFDEKERLMEEHYRYHIVQRLFQYFQPMSIHIDMENRISRMIRQGYISRNPFNKEYIQSFHEGYAAIKDKNINLITNKIFSTTANGFTIIGASGMGKSMSITRLFSLYPQVIIHSKYNGVSFSQYQVTWLKIDCPHDGSVRGLCIDFLIKIDEILGTDYYKKTLRGNSSANTMLPVICQIAKRCGLGMLVIDEIQHLSLAKSGGADKMLNFFVTLINTIGVPVILIGTNKAMPILQSQFRQARRGSGQGDMFFDRIKSKDEPSWILFTDMLFEYQWVRKPQEINQELRGVLYEESQGILDIAVKLFVMAQIRAIATNKEEITSGLIKYIGKENLKLVKPMLDALKEGNKEKIEQYEDISPIDFDEFIGKQLTQININSKIKEMQQIKKKTITIDNDIKEQAILKLLDLDVNPIKAKKYVEKILNENFGDVDIKDIVKKVYRIIIEDENSNEEKQKKKGKVEYGESDLRYIVEQGRKQSLTAYDAINNSGYIKPPVGNFLKIG